MHRHFLKIWPEHFQPVHDGLKKAELRKDDRMPYFARHDELVLQEWDADDGEFTGREVAFKVSHALRGGLVPKGYVMLSGDRLKCSCCDGWTYMPLAGNKAKSDCPEIGYHALLKPGQSCDFCPFAPKVKENQ